MPASRGVLSQPDLYLSPTLKMRTPWSRWQNTSLLGCVRPCVPTATWSSGEDQILQLMRPFINLTSTEESLHFVAIGSMEIIMNEELSGLSRHEEMMHSCTAIVRTVKENSGHTQCLFQLHHACIPARTAIIKKQVNLLDFADSHLAN